MKLISVVSARIGLIALYTILKVEISKLNVNVFKLFKVFNKRDKIDTSLMLNGRIVKNSYKNNPAMGYGKFFFSVLASHFGYIG